MKMIKNQEVNIYEFPVEPSEAKENTRVTIGDLHGNAMKLMFMLAKQGIATNITPKNYHKLAEIYKKQVNQLTKQDIETFNHIISEIQFNKSAIRLIGDELADRGSNDYFTLKILEQLHKQHVPVEIIISNHSVDFLRACELYDTNQAFVPPTLQGEHASSLYNLNILIEKELVDAAEVLDIAETAYKPCLKAISCSLKEENTELIVYSHAPIGLNTIESLAEQFKVPYKDSTSLELAECIDRINKVFQEYVQAGTVHTQCPEKEMILCYSGMSDRVKTALVLAMWNRDYVQILRPDIHNRYKIIYVHGHDPRDPDQDKSYVINLDANNELGKHRVFNKGLYAVLETYTKNIPSVASYQNFTVYEVDQKHDEVEEENPSLDPTILSLDQLKKSFEEQLKAISEAAQILYGRGETAAGDAAYLLYKKINDSYQNNIINNLNVEQFKIDCTYEISEARPQLERHRGWKRILRYLACTITGIGFLFVLADVGHKLITGKHLHSFKQIQVKS